MTDATTALWTRWVQQRDGAAFAALVVPELPRAVAVARGAGCDASRAEDAVQDALVALAQEKSAAPLDLGLRVWLFRAVRDRARSLMRAEKRRRTRETAAARPETSRDAPRTETTELVEQALATLDADDREAVRLRHALDLDYAEVARILGTSEGAARVRVHRALERLRKRLGGDAPTMLAAMPLPLVLHGEALVKSALVKAAATGAVVGTGGTIVATTMKTTVLAALLAFALGAGVTAVATGLRGPGTGTAAQPQGASPLDALAPDDTEKNWLADALAKERERRKDSAVRPEDSGIDLLRRYATWKADVTPALASYAAARAHIRIPEGSVTRVASTGDVTEVDLATLRDATVIEFGPGRFVLRQAKGTSFPVPPDREALEIRGAGMDRTTLLGPDGSFLELRRLKNLFVHDLTFESLAGTREQTFLSFAGEGSAALERVRTVGPRLSGYSSTMAVARSGSAFLACRECDFSGPGGFVLNFQGTVLAVFEKCHFAEVSSAFLTRSAYGPSDPPVTPPPVSIVRVLDSRFDNARLVDRPPGPDDVRVHLSGVQVTYGPPSVAPAAQLERWGGLAATTREDVTLTPSPVVFAADDLQRALEQAEAAGIGPLASVQVDFQSERLPVLAFDVLDAAKKSTVRTVRAWSNGRLVELPDAAPATSQFEMSKGVDFSGLLSFAELARRISLPSDENVMLIGYSRGRADGKDTVHFVAAGDGRWRASLDARTGEPVSPR